jgi:Tol biopolymer transport system component
VTIRFQYGEPDKITTDSSGNKETKEWWYWKKGISFKFEKLDTGWNLINSDEFPPMTDEASSYKTTESNQNQDDTIYYTFDRNIWSINADGTSRKWVAQGTHPTTTSDGEKMLLVDTNGNIYLIEPKSESPGKMVVGRRKAGFQPAISNNGKAVVYTQKIEGNRRIVLKDLEKNEENTLPIASLDLYYPTWSFDDTLIAYSASAVDDQQNLNRDIYYYDLTSRQIERLTMNPLDEFEPAWSLNHNKTILYCRVEGEHSQIWMVNFDDKGKPVERQLTKFGGQNPAWSPKGDRIIYENNSQLWTIKSDGSDEKPIIINDEPIFGLDPFWTR